ncbi:MAG: hypothetical protein ACRCWU_02290 [Metamycoplasmataceae bacterium]
MKKILLGTGALVLAVIPVAAVVSCSSSGTTLKKEAEKFNTSVPTKATGMNSSDAAGSIFFAKTPAEKKAALVELAKTIPTLDSEYEFAVLSAEVDSQTTTTINVEIDVYSGANHKSDEHETVTFKVTGFSAPATLQDEATKFGTTLPTKEASKTPAQAALQINEATPEDEKWEVLKTLITLPVRGSGFKYEITTAEADIVIPTQMIVKIKITKLLTSNETVDVELLVTGFTDPTTK